jgi:imidazolonepropionase-like amidohydrolase
MQIVIQCAQLIDGRGGEPLRDAVVVVDGQHLRYIGPARGTSWSPDARIIDLPGSTVLPGLIDVHVHLMNDGGPAAKNRVLGGYPGSAGSLTLIGYHNGRRALDAGYTTLRDCHAPYTTSIDLRDAIEGGRVLGPRLRVCGQGLCITGGHMDKTTLPDDVTGRVGICDTPDSFRQAVRYWVKMGADFIKLNSDVGSWRNPAVPSVQEMSFDEMAAACTEARRFGLHVAAHTSGGPPIEDAILAGVTSIEHGHWLTDRAIELMVEHGTYYVPTLIVNTRNFDYDRETLGVSEEGWDWLRRAYDAKWHSLERARAAGVKIAAGSDAGFLVSHGENACELVELVKGGFSPLEAITAATKTAADLLGLGDQIGTLEAGKLADVLVVDGDPLEDISILTKADRIAYVLQNGRPVKCESDHRSKWERTHEPS